MAGQDFNTMTPGSAVADSLEDILTRKRNESRQAMLDSLTRQNDQVRNDYMRENSLSLAQQREARAQEYKAQADKNRLAMMGQNPADVDKSTYDWGSKVSPGSFRVAPGATLSSTATTGTGSTLPMSAPSIGPAPTPAAQPPALPVQKTAMPSTPDASIPATYQYLGSQQYQQHEQITKALQDLANDPTFASADPIHKELMLASKLPQYNPEGAAARILTDNKLGDQTAFYYNSDKHRLEDASGAAVPPAIAAKIRKDQIIPISHAPREPQTPAASTPFISGTMPDPNNPGQRIPAQVQIQPGMINKNTGLITYPPGFTPEGKLGTTPRVPPVKPAKVDDKDWSLYLNAKSAALRAPDDPKTEDLLNSQANKVINTSSNDPTVKAFISKAWTYKQARSLPADVIMSKMKEGSTPLTGPQKQEITQIWNQLKFDSQGQ